MPCRDGERLRSTLDGVGGGDLGRFAALAKGDVVDANASNPVRLWACDVDAVEDETSLPSLPADVEEPPRGEEVEAKDENEEVVAPLENALAVGLPLLLAAVQGEVEGCFAPKIRGPETFENGDVVDAYAIKPPYASRLESARR